ncbi:hypothetical protein [Clostridium manihotivorum]|uniref:Uncharacterized protein n=1 Tax=Clostridium manihotivorum TaxID=2320868 RepID=A0A410DWG5_9CLOT|nr:hypothetical protein [Clostridium manihotivorum]QAA33371.1 hypothetical protein C1I91_17910 [Clostridium manihotivorum]
MGTASGSILIAILSGIVSWIIYVILNKKYMISKKLSKIIPGQCKVKSFIWRIISMILVLIICILSIFVFKIPEKMFLIVIGGIVAVGNKVANDLKFNDGI